MNSDGTVVVGDVEYETPGYDYRAIRWTAADGMMDLGVLPGWTDSFAYDVSEDGNVVVGQCYTEDSYCGFWWTPAGGLQELPAPSGWRSSSAYAVSMDGRVIIGVIVDEKNTFIGCRWIDGGIAEPLPIPTGSDASSARAMTPDGGTIAMGARFGEETRVFLWSELGGFEDLGVQPGNMTSDPYKISHDGNAIIGFSWGQRFQPFYWRRDIGWQDVNVWWGFVYGEALSATGVVMVGSTLSLDFEEAPWYWREDLGYVFLSSQREFMGLQLGVGDRFTQASDISADGTTMLLSGRYRGDEGIFLMRGLPRVDGLCLPDFTDDGTLDMFDVQAFLTRYASGSTEADLQRDGVLDFFDLQAFLTAFAAGCDPG